MVAHGGVDSERLTRRAVVSADPARRPTREAEEEAGDDEDSYKKDA